jgi:hypothetical protein
MKNEKDKNRKSKNRKAKNRISKNRKERVYLKEYKRCKKHSKERNVANFIKNENGKKFGTKDKY